MTLIAQLADLDRPALELLRNRPDFSKAKKQLIQKATPTLKYALEYLSDISSLAHVISAARADKEYWHKFKDRLFPGFDYTPELLIEIWENIEDSLKGLHLNVEFMYEMFMDEGILWADPELQFMVMDWDYLAEIFSDRSEWASLLLFLNMENVDAEDWESLNEDYGWITGEFYHPEGIHWNSVYAEFKKSYPELITYIRAIDNTTGNFYFTWDDHQYIAERREFVPGIRGWLKKEWKKADKLVDDMILADKKWEDPEYRKAIYEVFIRNSNGRS